MPQYEIVTDFERVSPDVVERARHVYFCMVGCRIGPRYVADTGIQPLEREWRICGPAFTVRPENTDDVLMAQIACKYVKPGDVVVIDARGDDRAAALGASMSAGLKEMGATGIVVDGYVLTAEVIRKREGIPVFCRGTVARSNGADHPGWLNGPVVIGGVIVHPGDLILGDEDGVVVVPRLQADEVIGYVEGRGNEREKAKRPLDGVLPDRSAQDKPYYVRCGAEDKIASRDDVVIRDMVNR